eukprot:jgi/Tetstr1/422313/TSEL_013157.t1
MASDIITFPLDPKAEEGVPMDQEKAEGDVEEDPAAADGGDAADDLENMGPDTLKVAFPAAGITIPSELDEAHAIEAVSMRGAA